MSKYGTQVMKEEECLLFLETAIENGAEVQEAIQDMRMIDNLLHVERNYLIAKGYVTRTKSGYYKKGSLLSESFNSVITARALGHEM